MSSKTRTRFFCRSALNVTFKGGFSHSHLTILQTVNRTRDSGFSLLTSRDLRRCPAGGLSFFSPTAFPAAPGSNAGFLGSSGISEISCLEIARGARRFLAEFFDEKSRSGRKSDPVEGDKHCSPRFEFVSFSQQHVRPISRRPSATPYTGHGSRLWRPLQGVWRRSDHGDGISGLGCGGGQTWSESSGSRSSSGRGAVEIRPHGQQIGEARTC